MKRNIITSLIVFITTTALASTSILNLKESITDTAIVFPESFETDTHKLMDNWYMQNYIVLNDQHNEDKPLSLSDEVIIKRLSEMPTTIEMPYNQVVRSYIEAYVSKRRSLVERMLGMSLYYLPIFEEALEREELPLELRYLPIIESALNPNAVSRVGATGLWQFMLATARGLGMEITSLVDERRDPYRASEAAAKYLKQLYGIYNDWSLAIAAYNCGPGNINKALRRAGEGKHDFWSIYYFLPAETRGYVPAFIAANYVMTYYNMHDISPALAKRPIVTDSIHVTKRVHFKQIAEVLDIPLEEIRILNPQFRKDIIPGNIKPYALVLPSMQVYSYIMSEDSIINHNASTYGRRLVVEPAQSTDGNSEYVSKLVTKYHTVKKGETLSKIAKKYGVTINNIKKWNKLKKNSIRRGQRLKISSYELVAVPKKKKATPQQTPVANSLPADSVSNDSIANDSISTDSLTIAPQNNDNLKVDSVKVSSTDIDTSKKSTKENKPKYVTHKVRKGETLSKIAAKYRGVTIADIKKANNLTGSKITVGQRLKIPQK